jgi:septal ring factor EnvC (AmiA/AmiB activator)
VRAVYGGKVLFAQDFEGFGLTVVLSHGGGVLSLYAGLEVLLVGKGDVVVLETPLGSASDELYFEIREQNEAVDPRGWLR